MILLRCLVFLLPLQAFGAVDPFLFSGSLFEIEESLNGDSEISPKNSDITIIERNYINRILSDKLKRVDPSFDIPSFFERNVFFWFNVYTRYSGAHVLIHDKNNLAMIYETLDFSEFREQEKNPFISEYIQIKITRKHVSEVRETLKQLLHNKPLSSLKQKEIFEKIKSMYKIPKDAKGKKSFFRKRLASLRTQTGQKDMIYKGLVEMRSFWQYFANLAHSFKLPKELLAITFLESSFNLNAISRVGAAGPWQFMPYIANKFMPKISNNIDYRLNPIISTIAALHLLKQNKMILKRWDLAVAAYNSGTKHLIRARRKFKRNIDLAFIVKNYKHAHLGFASINFYSEFLALTRVLDYQETLFNINQEHKDQVYYIYKTIKNLKKDVVLKNSSLNMKDFQKLNNHFLNKSDYIQKGTLIVLKEKIKNKDFVEIPRKTIFKKYPKYW